MKCNKCGGEFEPRHWQKRSGTRCCLDCRNAERRAHYAEHREEIRAKARLQERTDEYRAMRRRWAATKAGKAANRRRNQKKYAKPGARAQHRAHTKVFRAVAKGVLARPDHCELCDESRTEAHHPDYDKPLDVMWLCPKHHRAQHETELVMAAW